jgi:DNA replication and repair protein RecF
VYVAALRVVNFRGYRDSRVRFSPGMNVIVGENASGKTNLLEAAHFALRATSPRTSREEKLVRWGEGFTRVAAEVGRLVGEEPQTSAAGGERLHTIEVAYVPGQGKRVRLDGVDVQNQGDLRRRAQAFIFVPESLLLVKGSPARRRAHLDAFAAAIDPAYEAAAQELQLALRQRNAQLLRVREGADPGGLDAWDRQLARAALELGRRRGALVDRLAACFAPFAAALAPAGGEFALQLVSQLDETGFDEAAYLAALRSRRAREVARGASAFGPQRDDLLVAERRPDGSVRDLRLFGSQGEQRAAVLALLLAERAVAEQATGDRGTLFLDDVMSELDDARRRLLARVLADGGQSIITTTNLLYFTGEELGRARVIELPLLECRGEASGTTAEASCATSEAAGRPAEVPGKPSEAFAGSAEIPEDPSEASAGRADA